MIININIFLYFATAIIMIWATSMSSLNKKNIKMFLPFFIFGIINSFQVGFIFLEVYSMPTLIGTEIVYGILLIWILIIVKKNGGVNK